MVIMETNGIHYVGMVYIHSMDLAAVKTLRHNVKGLFMGHYCMHHYCYGTIYP